MEVFDRFPVNTKETSPPGHSETAKYARPRLPDLSDIATRAVKPVDSRAIRKKVYRDLFRLQPPVGEHLQKLGDELLGKSMKSHVQVLATPTADTPGTVLLLHFDNKRYLIGSLNEGTQRLAVQMGARLLKLSECFMTGRSRWSNTGGLIGIILTIADASATSHAAGQQTKTRKAAARSLKTGLDSGSAPAQALPDQGEKDASRLTIFSPPNLNHTMATARRFVLRKGLPIEIHEVDEGETASEDVPWAPYWADVNIKVWALSVKPNTNGTKAVSPRKRDIDEFLNGNSDAVVSNQQRSTLSAKDVVAEMFNSTWSKEGLFESRLGDVVGTAELFIRDPSTKKLQRYYVKGDDPDLEADKTVLVRKPWPGALVETLPPTKPRPEAISYIIRNHRLRGKFNPERATALKVEKGKKWSQLANMQSVTNTDGETITPEMVLGESKEGGGLAIVDIPEMSYIEATLRRPEWRQREVMAGVGAFFWICGRGVAGDAKLQDFMREFKDYEHIVSSPEHCPNNIAFDSATASTVRLGLVDPKRFSVPDHDNVPSENSSSLPDNARQAARGQVIDLTPSFDIHEKQVVPHLDIKKVESAMSPEVMKEAARAQAAIKADEVNTKEWANTLPPGSTDAEITTLGTGSALPSKYRNVSATLLRLPGWGNVLFDCGENTLGQLRRVFPAAEFKQVLRDLKIIFISHMHADHHLGTASVIKAWYEEVHGAQPLPADQDAKTSFATSNGLAVVSDASMLLWLHEYASIEDYGFSRIAPICSYPARDGQDARMAWYILPEQFSNMTSEQYRQKLSELDVKPSFLNLADLETVFVQHCFGARAVSITFPSGFKASYSGDCRPSPAFSRIGQGSTVCIHEATFDDELRSDALHKKHSTTSEALGVAQAMNARACVLTHFSQRYQKLPVIERAAPEEADDVKIDDVEDEEGDDTMDPGDVMGSTQVETEVEAVKFKLKTDMKVCVAFDYMRVKVGEIPELTHFTPALLKLFAEETVETTQ